MKLGKILLVSVPVFAGLHGCEVVPREVPQYSIEDFLKNTSYGGGDFSPDGSKLLVHHDASGVFNAYAVPVGGGEPTQLTTSTEDAVLTVSYFGDDERFLYTSDQGGNELNHLYVQDANGDVTDLTPGDNLKAQFSGWSSDRSSFFVATNERDPRFFDVYRYQAADGYQREMIFQNDDGHFPGVLSDDGRYITLIAVRTTNDSDLYVQNLVTGERTHITPHEGDVSSSPNDFSSDGRYLYYTTNQDGEYQRLFRYELQSGDKEEMVASEWDVMYAGLSRGGKYLTVGINADARTDLRVYDAETMELVPFPEIPGANVTSVRFSADDAQVAMYASGSRFPSDIFVQSMDGGEPRRLSNSLNENIDSENLVDATIARFESYDGLEIPGVLYKPHQATSSTPAPALVWVHGGPGGQSRVGYSGLIQYLVNHGYVIYAINNRGSSGYGKSFVAMDDQKHGEADLKDVVASKQMLIETGYVDRDKIGIIGGSYGGYMVVAALAFEPEVFEVGVDIFGVTNWLRTLESIPPWWEGRRRTRQQCSGGVHRIPRRRPWLPEQEEPRAWLSGDLSVSRTTPTGRRNTHCDDRSTVAISSVTSASPDGVFRR